MERRIAITGAGLISSLGNSPAAMYVALCEGRTGLRHLEQWHTHGDGCHLGGLLQSFKPEDYLQGRPLRPLDRPSQMTATAAMLTLENSGWTTERRARCEVGLALGTMFGGIHTISEFDRTGLTSGPASTSPMAFANTVINASAGQTAIWHGLRGVNTTIAAGSISGLAAIGQAADLIRCRKADAILAGGVEEFCFETFHGLGKAKMLCTSDPSETPTPFDERRNGFALGEGAALLMLEDWESVQSDRKILGEIKGHGHAFDASRGRNSECATHAIVRAMRKALQNSNLSPSDIDLVSASANGSLLRDCYEARALQEIFGAQAKDVPITAIKGATGETLGASGALQTITVTEIFRDHTVPGIADLNLSPDFPLPGLSRKNQSVCAQHALINAVGLDGNAFSLVISAVNV